MESHRSPPQICSTATIRGAKDDAHLMYGRRLNVFLLHKKRSETISLPSSETISPEEFMLESSKLATPPLLERPVASMLQPISTLSQQGVSDENLDSIGCQLATLTAYVNYPALNQASRMRSPNNTFLNLHYDWAASHEINEFSNLQSKEGADLS